MKKLLITILSTLLILIFSSQAYATSNATTVQTKIDYVYYDTNDHTYYLVTVKDSLEGRWVFNVQSSVAFDTNTLNHLNEAYKGKQTTIKYFGDAEEEDSLEIISCDIEGHGNIYE